MKWYFRPGVGCVIYRDNAEVLTFERTDIPHTWQFPQGGIDIGEKIDDTLWRELKEETGITKDQIESSLPYPKWTVYAYSEEMRKNISDPFVLGQVHRWFFLKLKNDVVIDLINAHDREFSAWRWSTFEATLAATAELKKPIYQDLADFFNSNIKI